MSRRSDLPCVQAAEQFPTQDEVVRIHGRGWRCTRCAAHPTEEPMTSTVWAEAEAERARARAKHGDQSMDGPLLSWDRRLAILTEEVGEVATALNDHALSGYINERDLRAELVQVCAMAGAWADRLDPVCRICDGRGWVDDDGWEHRWPGDHRSELEGYLPCHACNPDGDDPLTRQDAQPPHKATP